MAPNTCNEDETNDNEANAEDDTSKNENDGVQSMAELEGQQGQGADGTRTESLNLAHEQDSTGPSQRPTSATRRVTTKTQDGGQVSSAQDAFMLYSDDNTRMMEILGLRDDATEQIDLNHLGEAGDDESDRQDNANGNRNEPASTERKTRISFEVHGSVFVSDL